MLGAVKSEIIFITAMMILILIISAAAVFLFLRQYKREMLEKKQSKERKSTERSDEIKPAEDSNGTSADIG